MRFEKNDPVRIIDGPFAHFPGQVDEVDTERGSLRVMVTIFETEVPLELNSRRSTRIRIRVWQKRLPLR